MLWYYLNYVPTPKKNEDLTFVNEMQVGSYSSELNTPHFPKLGDEYSHMTITWFIFSVFKKNDILHPSPKLIECESLMKDVIFLKYCKVNPSGHEWVLIRKASCTNFGKWGVKSWRIGSRCSLASLITVRLCSFVYYRFIFLKKLCIFR